MADSPVPASRRSWRRAAPPLLLCAAAAVLLYPYLLLGRAMLPLELVPLFQPWAAHARELWPEGAPSVHNPLLDSLQQYYPRREFMTGALRAGWLPLWNPGVYGGSPFLAAQQGAVLYPPAWVLALVAPARQIGWSAFFHLCAALVGGYLLFHSLRLRPAAAAAGAAAFAFNGFVVIWLAYPNVTQWTLCWLPAILYLWERGRQGEDLRWMGAAGAALALPLLGGHAQSAAYTLLVWVGWAAFRSAGAPRLLPALARGILFPGCLALGLALGHVLPALDYLPRTDRAGRIPWDQVAANGMPPAQLWTLFLPRLFGDGTLAFAQQSWQPAGGHARLEFIERSFYPGVSVLVLAVAGVLARGGSGEEGKAHRRLALFGALLAVLGVLWAMATPLYRPLWWLPGFGQFTAVARIVCIAAWGLACLAALGVQALTDPAAGVRLRAFRAAAAAAAAGTGIVLAGHFVYGGADPLGVGPILASGGIRDLDSAAAAGAAMALLWLGVPVVLAGLSAGWGGRARIGAAAAGGLAAAAVTADLIAFGLPYNPAADPGLLRADTPEIRALMERDGPFRFLSAGPPGQETDIRKRMPSNLPSTFGLRDLAGSDSFVSRRYREWEEATRQAGGGGSAWTRPAAPNLRSAGVRFYLTAPAYHPRGLRPAAGSGLWEDPAALPYARLHGLAASLGTREGLLEALARPDRAPAVAMTTAPTGLEAASGAAVTPFRVRPINGGRMLVQGEAPAPGLLVVAEGYDPGWRARIGGRPVPVVPADHLLLGVVVGAGSQSVLLSYEPAAFRVGAFGSLAALAFLCGLFAAGCRGAPRLALRRRGPL